MPNHTHDDKFYMLQDGYNATIPKNHHYFDTLNWASSDIQKQNIAAIINPAFTGGSQAHNNMQPFLSVFMFKRTA